MAIEHRLCLDGLLLYFLIQFVSEFRSPNIESEFIACRNSVRVGIPCAHFLKVVSEFSACRNSVFVGIPCGNPHAISHYLPFSAMNCIFHFTAIDRILSQKSYILRIFIPKSVRFHYRKSAGTRFPQTCPFLSWLQIPAHS